MPGAPTRRCGYLQSSPIARVDQPFFGQLRMLVRDEPAHAVLPKRTAPLVQTLFPLQASSDGHTVIDATGTPFFIQGDSAQGFFRLSSANAASYLSSRIAQGYNAFMVEMMGLHTSGGIAGTGYGGVLQANNTYLPFVSKSGGGSYAGTAGTADFSTPNDNYWNYVASLVQLAQAYGVMLLAYVCPWGFGGDGTQGWWLDLGNAANTQTVCNGFGQYLAGKFKNFSNVVWLDGSDYFGTTTTRSPDGTTSIQRAYAIAQGMQTAGALQLRSGDWVAPSGSADGPADRPASFVPIMQLNGTYSAGGSFTGSNSATLETPYHTFTEAFRDYTYTPAYATQGNVGSGSAPPALPAYGKEFIYQDSGFEDGSRSAVRRGEWWAVLSGNPNGLFYGDESIWPFTDGTWQGAISHASGATDLPNIGTVMRARKWWLLVPSEAGSMPRLVTTANGTRSGEPNGYVSASCASDGSFLLAYVPVNGTGSQTFTLLMTALNGTKSASWIDPTTLAVTAIGSFPNTGSQSFTTPAGTNGDGHNDWILVIE